MYFASFCVPYSSESGEGMSDSEIGDFLDLEAEKSSDGEDGSGTSSGESEEEEDDDGERDSYSSVLQFCR